MQLLTSALAAAALAGPALADLAAVHNMCGQAMYLWSVGDTQSQMYKLPDQTTAYKEQYRARNGGGGTSIKICKTPELTQEQTQFEYTLDHSMNKIWYDLSNVNGNALQGVEYELKASDPSCPVVHCAASDAQCKSVYNVWNDDAATHACDINSDLLLTLCPSGSGTSGGSTAPSSSSPAVSSGPYSVGSSSASGQPVGEYQPGATGAPAAKNQAKASTSGSSSNTSGSDLLSGLPVSTWLAGPNTPSKREESTLEHVARHAHAHAHERLRRSRVFRSLTE